MNKYVLCIMGKCDISIENLIQINNPKSVLKEIDSFTSRFKDEQELKKYLVESINVTNVLGSNKGIRLRFIGKDREYFLPIIYKNQSYLLNAYNVKNAISKFQNENNLDFFEDMIEFYSKMSTGKKNAWWESQKLSMSKIYFCLENFRNSGYVDGEITKLFNDTLSEFINKSIYTRNSKGQFVENYNGIRILSNFIFDYYAKQEQIEKYRARTQQLESLKSIKKEILPSDKENSDEEYIQLKFY